MFILEAKSVISYEPAQQIYIMYDSLNVGCFSKCFTAVALWFHIDSYMCHYTSSFRDNLI